MASTLLTTVRTGRCAGAVAAVLLVVMAAQVIGLHRVVMPPLVRTVAVGQGPSAVAVDSRRNRVFVANYANGSVSVLDARSGARLGTVPVGRRLSGLAVASGTGRVFVANQGSDSVSVLDARTGAVLDTVPVGRGPTAVAVDEASGRVVVPTSDDHSVSILDAHSGGVLWTVALDQGASGDGLLAGAMAVAVDGRTGRAFMADSDANSVNVLDVRAGGARRTVAVGVHPQAVAVDERTGRAFVVNYGGTVRESVPWWEHDVQRLRHWLPWLPRPALRVHTKPGSVSVIDVTRV